MAVNSDSNPATHLGRQMKRDRMAHGWSLRDFGARVEVHIGTLSQVENGRRPMTEALARKCDEQFPERRGWYSTYYEESKSWVPAGFRSWAEYEDKAATLRSWVPSVIDGFLQTPDYARAVLATELGATDEQIAARLASRMARQQRVLHRDPPPRAWFVVDEVALYRLVGSAEVMVNQMRHLTEVAAMPNVTVTVMPPVLHPANESGFIVTSDAAYAEHVAGGYVFTDDRTVSSLAMRFDTLRAESRKASESVALIERTEQAWNRLGGSRPIAGQPAGVASKSRRPRASSSATPPTATA